MKWIDIKFVNQEKMLKTLYFNNTILEQKQVKSRFKFEINQKKQAKLEHLAGSIKDENVGIILGFAIIFEVENWLKIKQYLQKNNINGYRVRYQNKKLFYQNKNWLMPQNEAINMLLPTTNNYYEINPSILIDDGLNILGINFLKGIRNFVIVLMD